MCAECRVIGLHDFVECGPVVGGLFARNIFSDVVCAEYAHAPVRITVDVSYSSVRRGHALPSIGC